MELHALVTLELLKADNDIRDKFYEILEEENWKKIQNISTTWKVSFNDNTTRGKAISILEKDINKAKINSKAQRVDYAYQIAEEKITIGKLKS